MKEEFIHFIWKNRLFGSAPFMTVNGKSLEVIDPGAYNRDSGPDFFNSRIRLDNTVWAGNVEIHINASDWYRHKHHLDSSYNNVILHVVVNYDKIIKTESGDEPETFVITWNKSIENKYLDYQKTPEIIACSSDIQDLPSFLVRHWISRMAIERLEEKVKRFEDTFISTGKDWDETLYRLLSRYFGLKVNADPFYLLASSTPLRIIRKHADNRMQIEALLFGQAGMLEPGIFDREIYDDYYLWLCREYRILKKKYDLKPVDPWIWKYHRLRPSGFPGIRISQLADILSSKDFLFAGIKDCRTVKELRKLFTAAASEYWNDHFIFGAYKRGKVKRTGVTMTDLLLINMVIPLLFLYGRSRADEKYCTKAVDLFDSIEPENNRITREWRQAGIYASSALESQGLIHLRDKYCKNRLCLDCQYGSKLISLGKDIDNQHPYLLEEPLKEH